MPKITDEPVDEKFGIRFRTAWLQSKFRDLNQKELSQKFGYSQQGMSFIANGHRYPHLSTGLKIAQEFNCSMDWLYTCLLYTSPSPRDRTRSRMPSSA